MAKTVKDYVDSCLACQKKARAVVKDRVPICVIPRDEIPFSHIYLDIIGPLTKQADFRFCFCVIDSCTRFRFAFRLRSVTAKAVCECLLQIFALVGVSKVITSDQGTCFTSQLTQEFIKLFGCSPRFFTHLHPEGNSLLERLDQTVKKMLHHVCQKDPPNGTKCYHLFCGPSENLTRGQSNLT